MHVLYTLASSSLYRYDLLIRHRSRELACDIIVVVSNHETLKPVADMFGIPFKHLPIPPKDAGGKRVQELQVRGGYTRYVNR
jgi:formyltetrahydrofolate hydrolase